MGTNYYVHTNICPTCRRPDEEVHIGKSSGGWQFLFQYNGGRYYKTFEEFKAWLLGKVLKDEYGGTISHNDLWKMIGSKKSLQGHCSRNLIILDGYEFLDSEFS